MKHRVDKDILKVGDEIYVKIPIQIGWSWFRYPMFKKLKIERITPARTKFIMENGVEYNKNEPFYEYNEKYDKESQVALCARYISHCRNYIENVCRDGKLYSQDDKTIIAVANLYHEIVKELKVEDCL